MPHEAPLLFAFAFSLIFALAAGLVAVRIGLPPIVGYLIAGIAIGPFTPGFVADSRIETQLADIGVMLMMFGVGMHFSLEELWAVRKIAIPGAILQVALATALGAGAAHLWGWQYSAGLVFGLALSIASTVVVFRALEERNSLKTHEGHIAAGWLVVEDLVTVIILVILPLIGSVPASHSVAQQATANGSNPLITVGITLGKAGAFILLMLVAGIRFLPWLLDRVQRTGSRDLFTVAVAAIAVGVAYGSAELFGVSFALGAFFAGVVIKESDHNGRAAEEMFPLQSVFTVLFFVSVGMLFDPAIIGTNPVELVTVVAIIVIGKPIISFLLVVAMRYPLASALTIAACLGQIGEFSFILGERAVSFGLLPPEAQSLIVVGALVSITLNPLEFRAASVIEASRAAATLKRSAAASLD
ncbi:MAG TPA: cation:proton antiporter [Candidatus Binataceae bacterium]|nr:cation:proton antiporter [Candidatus Binataceae bacterium]